MSQTEPTPPVTARPLVLLVEDDELVRTTLRLMLERSGFEVEEARHGGEAVVLYTRRAADVVLTDLIMPDADGLETIQHLRRLRPAPRIIAMSGGGRISSRDYLKLAAALGARRTLAKPFTEADLITTIRAVLGES